MLKFFVKLVLLIFAVALGRFAYEKVIALPHFALDIVEIEGNLELSSDSILTLSGLERGVSIYRQNLKYAADILSRQRGVVECSVNRGFISTISIRVNIAEPALLISGNRLFGLSREGMVLPIDERMPILPLVTGRKFSKAKCYDHLKDPDIAYSLELYDRLMAVSSHLCARLSEINFGQDGLLRLYFSPDGTMVVMDKRDIGDAVKRLCALEDNGILIGERLIDLRYGPVIVESSIEKGML